MVDARGYLCPMPVVMVQKALEAEHPDTLEVLVDNETAVENIKRFAAHSGYQLGKEAMLIWHWTSFCK